MHASVRACLLARDVGASPIDSVAAEVPMVLIGLLSRLWRFAQAYNMVQGCVNMHTYDTTDRLIRAILYAGTDQYMMAGRGGGSPVIVAIRRMSDV